MSSACASVSANSASLTDLLILSSSPSLLKKLSIFVVSSPIRPFSLSIVPVNLPIASDNKRLAVSRAVTVSSRDFGIVLYISVLVSVRSLNKVLSSSPPPLTIVGCSASTSSTLSSSTSSTSTSS